MKVIREDYPEVWYLCDCGEEFYSSPSTEEGCALFERPAGNRYLVSCCPYCKRYGEHEPYPGDKLIYGP